MTERKRLLSSLAETVRDYRVEEGANPDSDQVDRWVRQFDAEVQEPILRELDHVLRKTYFSAQRVESWIRHLVDHPPGGGSSCDFWKKANFLRNARPKRSQGAILARFDTALSERCGLTSGECGGTGDVFVYLDDGVFSGEQMKDCVARWVESGASGKTLHVLTLVSHSLGEYWIDSNAPADVEISFGAPLVIENRKRYSSDSGVLWPTELPEDEVLRERYREASIAFREPGRGPNDIFSSEDARRLLEHEFTLAGARLISSAKNPNPKMRPLGFSNLGLGFGSMVVFHRNCPNNAPLVLWWGDPDLPSDHPLSQWFPLFRRKTWD